MKLEELLKSAFANENISALLKKAMSVLAEFPISAAVCKIGFNEVNHIKNKLRSLLHNDTSNSLLMMHVSGPPPGLFQPQSAVDDYRFGSKTVSHIKGCKCHLCDGCKEIGVCLKN
jgi:hypothetical protein